VVDGQEGEGDLRLPAGEDRFDVGFTQGIEMVWSTSGFAQAKSPLSSAVKRMRDAAAGAWAIRAH
jgi:hypothetical protein